jgi:hypothetical protein
VYSAHTYMAGGRAPQYCSTAPNYLVFIEHHHDIFWNTTLQFVYITCLMYVMSN